MSNRMRTIGAITAIIAFAAAAPLLGCFRVHDKPKESQRESPKADGGDIDARGDDSDVTRPNSSSAGGTGGTSAMDSGTGIDDSGFSNDDGGEKTGFVAIQGKITEDESGFADVTVTLAGTSYQNDPVDKSTLSDEAGNYSFKNLPQGSYEITPRTACHVFEPKSRAIEAPIAITRIDFEVGSDTIPRRVKLLSRTKTSTFFG
jgi:hypothetical protein